MKILIVSVLPLSYTSVDRLAEMVKKHNEHLDIGIFPFHGKRYSEEDLKIFMEKAVGVDLIDFEYWRGADVLLKKFVWLKNKKKILTHHNPYDLDKIDPKLFDMVVVKNKTQQKTLHGSMYIPHAVDLDFFDFNENYAEDKTVQMTAFRIEGKKGIREVAQVCKELGYRFVLVGHVSKPDYMRQIMEVNPDTIFLEDIDDDVLKSVYRNSAIHVCNSMDNFESGTMPILEAMACGIPVLTRNIGLVPDIYNYKTIGENMAVRQGATEDINDLRNELKSLMEDRERRLKMRQKAWDSVRNYSDYRMAKMFGRLYMDVMSGFKPLVSVITATYNRREQVLQIIEALQEQTYKNLEFVVCDDNSSDGTEEAVKSMREKVRFPIKYVNTKKTNPNDYGLAKARNLGVIEADGDFLMFLDSRLYPEKDAVERFLERLDEKTWIFGNKGYEKKAFVENFSMIRRDLFIKAGMFNERIDRYGGMSQELRNRFKAQGFRLEYIEEAKAKEILSAQKMSAKREDIIKMKNLLWKMET